MIGPPSPHQLAALASRIHDEECHPWCRDDPATWPSAWWEEAWWAWWGDL